MKRDAATPLNISQNISGLCGDTKPRRRRNDSDNNNCCRDSAYEMTPQRRTRLEVRDQPSLTLFHNKRHRDVRNPWLPMQ